LCDCLFENSCKFLHWTFVEIVANAVSTFALGECGESSEKRVTDNEENQKKTFTNSPGAISANGSPASLSLQESKEFVRRASLGPSSSDIPKITLTEAQDYDLRTRMTSKDYREFRTNSLARYLCNWVERLGVNAFREMSTSLELIPFDLSTDSPALWSDLALTGRSLYANRFLSGSL
jgi:hypothetical protein